MDRFFSIATSFVAGHPSHPFDRPQRQRQRQRQRQGRESVVATWIAVRGY